MSKFLLNRKSCARSCESDNNIANRKEEELSETKSETSADTSCETSSHASRPETSTETSTKTSTKTSSNTSSETSSKTFDSSKAAQLAISSSPDSPNPAFSSSARTIFIGMILTLLGGALWGTNATVSKILMGDYHVTPLQIACVRQLAAGVLFFITASICTRKQLVSAVKSTRSWGMFVLTGIVCVLLTQVSYLWAIDWTNSGTATVLQSLNLVFVLVYACLKNRRFPNVRENVGVLLAFVGTALMATGGDFSKLSLPIMGLIWGLVDAASTAALAIMPVKLIAKWGNLSINGITFIVAGLILLPFVRPWETMPALDWRGIALFAFTVVGGTFGAYWLFLSGIMRVGAVRGTLLGASEPVMAAITAVMFTGAVFSWADFVGFALIFIMMTLLR
ncbi:DMT family transporter [Gardnerella vaginalis]|uniref:DMT family transporter n=1 Tax=Gardnerella vaginalis TaxID=2702 RepID=UPI0009E30B5A|nr:DMT family transporter [Gardnerella vaginalis]